MFLQEKPRPWNLKKVVYEKRCGYQQFVVIVAYIIDNYIHDRCGQMGNESYLLLVLLCKIEQVFVRSAALQRVVPIIQFRVVGQPFDVLLKIQYDFLGRAVADMGQVDREAAKEHDDVPDFGLPLSQFFSPQLPFRLFGKVFDIPSQ